MSDEPDAGEPGPDASDAGEPGPDASDAGEPGPDASDAGDPAEAGEPTDGPAAGDHAVYVLECAGGSLYTGYTTDVARRVAEHAAGEGAKYTRGRTPVELVHLEWFDSRSAALSREHEIKARSRRAKERLVAASPTPSLEADGG